MAHKIDTPYITDMALLKRLEETVTGKMQYTLLNDFLAKYGLQLDLYALKGLLAAALKIPLDSITDIQVLNPTEPSKIISEKDCILDIKLELNHKEIINIEIQNQYQDFWQDRAMTYTCRMYDNLEEGNDYDNIKPCVHIGILNFSLNNTEEFYSDYRVLNTKTHEEFTNKLIIKVLMLNNIENATEEQKANYNSIYYWAKLFKAKTWEELRMIAEKNERMKSLVNTASELSGDRSVKEACEARFIYQMDINTYEHRIQQRDQVIEEQQGTIEEQRGQLQQKDELLEQKDELLEQKDNLLEQSATEIDELKRKLKEYEEKYK